jgi:ATP-binding cassette subfamily B protein
MQNSLLLWLYQYLKPHKGRIVVAMVALLISASAWLVLGQGIKYVIDEGFAANDPNVLNRLLLAVLGIALVGCIATYFRFYNMIWLGERVSANIRAALYQHMLYLDMAFYNEHRTGEVISRFTSDTTLLQNVIGMGLSMAIRACVTLIGAVLLMFFTSAKLTLLVLITIPIILLPIKLVGRRVRHFAQKTQDDVAGMSAHIDQSLHGIHTIQAYNNEAKDIADLHDKIETVMHTSAKRIHYRALLVVSIMGVAIFAVVVVAWLGATSVMSGMISAGSLSAFIFYAVLAGGAVATISEVIGEIQKAKGASQRIRDLLATPIPKQNQHVLETLPSRSVHSDTSSDTQAVVRLEHLSFTYPNTRKTVLNEVSFDLFKHQKIALVGPSGAGKSTLFDLLLGFYTPQQGHILLNGQPTHSMNLQDIRSWFALVPQEPVMFATDVANNIAYGDQHASQVRIEAAAKMAHAHDFITELEQGYATLVGERGVKLSGGQKQRIAIARAMLANRPILLLDEATSALDASSEKSIQEALANLMENRTSIVIAHRLATVQDADLIIVMDQGQIIAQGRHETLLDTCPLYRELAELQFIH